MEKNFLIRVKYFPEMEQIDPDQVWTGWLTGDGLEGGSIELSSGGTLGEVIRRLGFSLDVMDEFLKTQDSGGPSKEP